MELIIGLGLIAFTLTMARILQLNLRKRHETFIAKVELDKREHLRKIRDKMRADAYDCRKIVEFHRSQPVTGRSRGGASTSASGIGTAGFSDSSSDSDTKSSSDSFSGGGGSFGGGGSSGDY